MEMKMKVSYLTVDPVAKKTIKSLSEVRRDE